MWKRDVTANFWRQFKNADVDTPNFWSPIYVRQIESPTLCPDFLVAYLSVPI